MFEQTAALWRRLMGRSNPDSARTPNVAEEDRRVWVRFATDLETNVTSPNQLDVPLFGARIRDVSRGGTRLLANRPFDPGSMLTVYLPAANGQSSLDVLACVVHCIAAGENEWHLGCSFARELTDEDLHAFGAIKSKPTAPDPRAWTRYPVDVTATYQFVSGDDLTHYPARVRDISASGVALATDANIPTGTLLNAELYGHRGQQLTILACVVHISSDPEGGFITGCNFIRELSAEDLQVLS